MQNEKQVSSEKKQSKIPTIGYKTGLFTTGYFQVLFTKIFIYIYTCIYIFTSEKLTKEC